MLQCILTGRAQEAYSAVWTEEDLDHDMVKLAVMKS